MSRRNAPAEPNAFDSAFLADLDRLDEPIGAAEAETAGPWHVAALGDHWGVFPGGPAVGSGTLGAPVARFVRREHALLAAAVLPATGREPSLRLARRETAADELRA